MKKILTLFVMLLCGWSIVSAQPAFGYQMVVRDADNNLMANTNVKVTISVLNNDMIAQYSETKEVTTDELGMVYLLIGTEDATEFAGIQWPMIDSIETKIEFPDGELETVTYRTPLLAVPYALQAAHKDPLSLDQIVNYLSDPQTDIDDYKAIMAAVVSNGDLWPRIKNRVVNYLKNRKDKAVDILAAYLEQADSMDVVELSQLVDHTVKTKIMNLVKQSALDNKDYAMEVLVAYLPAVDAADVDAAFEAAVTGLDNSDNFNEDDKAELREKFLQHAVPFAKNHLNLVVTTANYFLAHATEGQINGILEVLNSETGKPLKEALVDNLFYNYLDYYLRPTIIQQLNGIDFSGYLPKKYCDGEPIDFCSMKRVLPQQ